MSTATTLLPTRTWLAAPPLRPQPTVISFMVQTVETDVKIQCFLPLLGALRLPAAPPPTRGCSSTLEGQISLMLVLSLFFSSLLLFSVSHSLPHSSQPWLFPINTFSALCSSVSKTGMTETSRPVPSIRRNDKVLKHKKLCGVQVFGNIPVTYFARQRQKDCKLEASLVT